MALVLIVGLVALDLRLSVLNAALHLFLLIVELVLEGQEVLIERNTVTQQRLVPTRLVLLIHFLVLQQLDLRLHRRNLLVQIHDDVLVDGRLLGALGGAGGSCLDLLGSLLEVRVTLKLLVNDRSRSTLIHIVPIGAEPHIAGSSAAHTAPCSAYHTMQKF